MRPVTIRRHDTAARNQPTEFTVPADDEHPHEVASIMRDDDEVAGVIVHRRDGSMVSYLRAHPNASKAIGARPLLLELDALDQAANAHEAMRGCGHPQYDPDAHQATLQRREEATRELSELTPPCGIERP